jgi:hypothetical protein
MAIRVRGLDKNVRTYLFGDITETEIKIFLKLRWR